MTINPEQFSVTPPPPKTIHLNHLLHFCTSADFFFFHFFFFIFFSRLIFSHNQSLYFFFFWKRLNWFWMASAAFSVSGASRSMSTSSSCSWGFAADAFSGKGLKGKMWRVNTKARVVKSVCQCLSFPTIFQKAKIAWMQKSCLGSLGSFQKHLWFEKIKVQQRKWRW